MIIPPGFPHVGQVCKLIRALYGLRQAPRAWYTRIDTFFRSLGLQKSNEDPNLYFSFQNGKHMIILLYVDDIIITGDDNVLIESLIHGLRSNFKMTDLGNATYYLGIELIQWPEDTYFHQRGYIKKILDRFGMLHCTPASTPMNPRLKLTKDTGTQPVDVKTY
jgi:hypothetical protein